MKILKRLFEIIFPARGPGCGSFVFNNGGLCSDCFKELHFIAEPLCPLCGLPFESVLADRAPLLCGACLGERPKCQEARAAMIYDDASKNLILPYKHADRTDLTPFFVNILGRAGIELIEKSDVVIPVPLHWRRLIARRYNQAALLAIGLAKKHGKTYLPFALIRRRHTRSQGTFRFKQRKENVRAAFKTAKPHQIQGKNVLLIDDVITTGATIDGCARALLRAGASSVRVLALAKVTLAHTGRHKQHEQD